MLQQPGRCFTRPAGLAVRKAAAGLAATRRAAAASTAGRCRGWRQGFSAAAQHAAGAEAAIPRRLLPSHPQLLLPAKIAAGEGVIPAWLQAAAGAARAAHHLSSVPSRLNECQLAQPVLQPRHNSARLEQPHASQFIGERLVAGPSSHAAARDIGGKWEHACWQSVATLERSMWWGDRQNSHALKQKLCSLLGL
jgi:hypothetical protein